MELGAIKINVERSCLGSLKMVGASLLLQRSDPLAVRKEILAVSLAERKKAWHKQVYAWYQNKNLVAGKNVRIYSRVLATVAK